MRDGAPSPAIEVTAPELFGSAQPWNFCDWQLEARDGLDAAFGNAGVALAKMSAHEATGAVSLRPDGGTTIWFILPKTTADSGSEPADHVAVRLANAWLIFPAQPPTPTIAGSTTRTC